MVRLNITAKIWLAIGIFVLGFVFCTALQQVQGRRAEHHLRTISEAQFPAALSSQNAESEYHEAMDTFSSAVLTQDTTDLEQAVEHGRQAVVSLRATAAGAGLPAGQAAQAGKLAAAVEEFLADARETYGAAVANPGDLTLETQRQMHDLAARTSFLRESLKRLKQDIATGVQVDLGALEQWSQTNRRLALAVLVSTLLISAVLVSWTIRRVITVPLARAEADLARERDLLRILLDNVPDYIFFKDAAGKYLRVNKAESGLLGVENEKEAIGRDEFDFFDREYAEEASRDEKEVLRTGSPLIAKHYRIQSGAATRWVCSTKVPVRGADQELCGLVCISRDVTASKQIVEALEKSEESFRILFAAIPHAVWVYDVGTLQFIAINEVAVCHYGYSEAEFREVGLRGLHPPEEQERLERALQSPDRAEALSGAWKHQAKEGRILEVEVAVRAFELRGQNAAMAIVKDVTEHNRIEAELRQAQRLESVGQLAAGIAHEINTPIQYVGDNIRFLRDAFDSEQQALAEYGVLREAAAAGPVTPAQLGALGKALEDADVDYLSGEVPKAIAQSLDGVERVATIVRAMKEFAHPGRKEKQAADLNRALENALIVARNEFKYVADAETDFGKLPPVVCRIAEINQVLLNLLVNAAQAIAAVVKETGQRGKITIRTWRDGNRAMIAISDTGCGIPETIRSKVFDPFFTTKPIGQGSGQGLTIARSVVVDKHGGSLTFEPNGTQGTTFLVALPIESVGEEAGDPAVAGSGVSST